MTSVKPGFRPQVEDLENRVVPASGLDADFFDRIQFEYQKAAVQEERVVRVVTVEYQNATDMATELYQEGEDKKADVQQQLMDALTAIVQGDAGFQQLVEQKVNEYLNKYNRDIEELRSAAQSALDNPPAGMTSGTILAWTAQQYENLTAGVMRQYNEVMLQYQYLQKTEQVQYAGAIASAKAQFEALTLAQNQLLDAYSNYQVELVNFYTNEVLRIRTELAIQLTALQQAYANQTQIVTTSAPTFSGGGGSTVFFDDNAPK